VTDYPVDFDLAQFLEATEDLEPDYPIEMGIARPLFRELVMARKVVDAVPATPLLRALADFLDMDDNRRGRKGDEVQKDLRRLANAYDDCFKAALTAHRQLTQEPGP
jgi:hypothetical protein